MRMSRREEKKKKTRERLHKCFASHRIKESKLAGNLNIGASHLNKKEET